MSGRLADAILVARDVYTRYPAILSQRLPKHGSLEQGAAALQRGVRVHEWASGSPPTLLDALGDMAAAMAGAPKFEIRTIMVPATVATVVRGEDGELKSPDRIMRSVLQRYRTSAIIRLLDNLNPCWTRFVICKELAHLIMGEANGARAQNMREQITMAYEIGKSARPDADLSGEQFAWFVAAELMLPIQDRDEFVRRMRSNEDRMSIARSYWVPKAVIDLFSETPYGEVSSSLIGA